MSQSRNADAPSEIPARGWWATLKRVWTAMGEQHLGLIAAGIAFYGLLALFPGITATLAIGGLVTDPATIADELDRISELMPADAASIVTGQIEDVASGRQNGLGMAALIGVGLALFSASKGAANLMAGLNIAYGETEKRGFISLKLWTLLMTAMVALGAILAAAFSIALPALLEFLPLPPAIATMGGYLRWPVMFAMVVLGLTLIYRFGPSRADAKWRWITPGAVAACVLWLLGSAGFGVYVRNFASYNETFGALGGVIILLMWLWLSAFIILLGAKLDAELEAQTARDTTTGPAKPMGERGAVKADSFDGGETPKNAGE